MAMEGKNWKEDRRKMIPLFFLQQCLSGIVIVPVILYGGYYHCHSIPVPKSNEFSEKLLYAVRYCTFPQVAFLAVAILRVGLKRRRTPAANPMGGMEHYILAEQKVLTNTVEQLLGFLLTVLALITYLEPLEMRIIPLYSILFIIGRILFMIGYSISPNLYRFLGMLINIHSFFFFFGYTIYLMYIRGFMYGIPAGSPSPPTFDTSPGTITPGKNLTIDTIEL